MRQRYNCKDGNNKFNSNVYPSSFVRGSFVLNGVSVYEDQIKGYATLFYLGKYRGGDIEHFALKGTIRNDVITARAKLKSGCFSIKLERTENNIWVGSYSLSNPHDCGEITCKISI